MNEFLFFLLVSKSPLEREREMQLEKSFFQITIIFIRVKILLWKNFDFWGIDVCAKQFALEYSRHSISKKCKID